MKRLICKIIGHQLIKYENNDRTSCCKRCGYIRLGGSGTSKVKLQTWSKLTNSGEFLTKKTISDEPLDEVVTIHAAFFKKSKEKQRKVLRILIWWAIKQYFKK